MQRAVCFSAPLPPTFAVPEEVFRTLLFAPNLGNRAVEPDLFWFYSGVSGRLTATGSSVSIGKPMFVDVLPEPSAADAEGKEV